MLDDQVAGVKRALVIRDHLFCQFRGEDIRRRFSHPTARAEDICHVTIRVEHPVIGVLDKSGDRQGVHEQIEAFLAFCQGFLHDLSFSDVPNQRTAILDALVLEMVGNHLCRTGLSIAIFLTGFKVQDFFLP